MYDTHTVCISFFFVFKRLLFIIFIFNQRIKFTMLSPLLKGDKFMYHKTSSFILI